MHLDVSQIVTELFVLSIGGFVGYISQQFFKMRRDMDAAHRMIRDIKASLKLCQTHREE